MRKRATGQKWREWYLLPLLIILLLWVPQVQAEELTELAEEVSFEDLDGVTLPQAQEKQSRIRGRRLLRSTSGSGRWYGSQLSSGDEQKMYQALVAARDDFRKMAQVYKANGNKRVAGSYVQVVLDDPIEYDPSINENRNGTTYITDPRYEEFRKLFNRALHAYVRDYVEDYWLSSFVVYPATDSIADSSLKQVVSVALVPKVFYNEATKYKNTAGYYDDILTELDQTDESLQDAIAKVAQEDTVYAKVRAAHDYAVELIIYGASDKEYGHTITGGLLKKYNHTAVCECYAKLFLLLCRANGIDCVLVTGGSRRDSNGDIISSHMWNYVQMDDGLWYLLDATWDDSYKNTTYFLAGAQSPNQTGVKTGVNTNTVAKDHMPVGGFSATVQYDPFTVPVWSENSYEENHAQILLSPQKEQVEVNVSETTALPTPSYHFADALENVTFTYTSSDRGIATVDTLGNVTGIKAGAVTITIANSRLPKVYCEITVTVKGAVEETAQDEVSGEHIPSGDDSTPSVPKTDGQDESGDENEPQKPGTGGQDESDQESESQKPGTGGQDGSDQENETQKPGMPGA
ncbi:MAG: transglutaminase domain-containing protein [Eubacteriales bacterium]|nr:transglutaminase domain-containing protein [Eubacteriales bacterium]